MDPTTPARRVPRRRREEGGVHSLRSNGHIVGSNNENGHHHPTNNHFGHDRYTSSQVYNQRQQSLRRRASSLLKDESSYNTASSYNDNGPSEIYAASRMHSDTRRRTIHSRLVRIIILCVIVFYFFEIGLGIVRSAARLVFGQRKEHQQQEFDTIDNLRFTLRGSNDKDSVDGGMSLHDLNAQSHLLKAEGESLQLLNEEDPIEDTTEEDKMASEGYEVYMGEDSTTDYFFAGNIKSTKNVVDKNGELKAITIPAQKYATLPFSVESNPFALSMWIYLSPVSEMDVDSTLEESRTTRVILSTLSSDGTDSNAGCISDIFGGPAKGIVVYAQPHYGDSSMENENQYRILLQYASADSKSCHTIGLNGDDPREAAHEHCSIRFPQAVETLDRHPCWAHPLYVDPRCRLSTLLRRFSYQKMHPRY